MWYCGEAGSPKSATRGVLPEPTCISKCATEAPLRTRCASCECPADSSVIAARGVTGSLGPAPRVFVGLFTLSGGPSDQVLRRCLNFPASGCRPHLDD